MAGNEDILATKKDAYKKEDINNKDIKNKDKDKSSYSRIKILECDIKLTKLLIDKILENNPESRVRKITNKQKERWQNDCRLMREQDKRTPEQIKEMINWTQGDIFWRGNILSMGKLREKWDMLTVRMKGGKTQQKKKSIFSRE